MDGHTWYYSKRGMVQNQSCWGQLGYSGNSLTCKVKASSYESIRNFYVVREFNLFAKLSLFYLVWVEIMINIYLSE